MARIGMPDLQRLEEEEEAPREPTLGELVDQAQGPQLPQLPPLSFPDLTPEEAEMAEMPISVPERPRGREAVFREAADASRGSPISRLPLTALGRALPAAESIAGNVPAAYEAASRRFRESPVGRVVAPVLDPFTEFIERPEVQTATMGIPAFAGVSGAGQIGKAARAAKGAKAVRAAEPPVPSPAAEAGGLTTPPAASLTPEELRRAVDAGVPLSPNPDEVRAALGGRGVIQPPSVPPTGGGALGGGGVIQPPSVPPTGGGTPGSLPPSGSPLDRTIRMFKEQDAAPTRGQQLADFRAAIPERYRAFQEALTDRFAGINAMKKGLTRKVSPLEDPEIQVARLGGIGDAQAQRAEDIARGVRTALGEPWQDVEYHLDSYLHLKQAIDIAAVKGAARAIPGGIKGPKEAQQGLSELQTLLGPERWERLERTAQAAVTESQATLQKLVDEGLVAQDLADALIRQYPHYNRQNILRETEHIISGVGAKRISVTDANLKRLTEKGTEQARASAYASIIGSAADAEALIFRNRAARTVSQMAQELGYGKRVAAVRKVAEVEGEAVFRRPPGEIRGTISYMEDGQRVVVEVPEWLEKEAKLIYETGDDVLLRSASIINSLPRSAFVTYNPSWPAANMTIDYFTALVTKGVSPIEEFRGLVGAIRDLSGNDPVLAQMRRSGGGQAGWFARGPQDIAKIVKESGNLAITDSKQFQSLLTNPVELFKATITAPFKGIRAAGQVAELATRRAAFVTSLKRAGVTVETAGPEALAQAAVDARRVSIDFQRAGNAARSINKLSVFFNAGVQGTLLPFRALRDSPRARWALGITLGANTGLYAWNRQFSEYKDVPADVRRGSAILMLPSYEFDQRGNRKPNYVTFIPKLREWGLFFGTQTYIMEKLDGIENESFGRFLALQQAQSTPIEGISAIVPTVPGQVALEESLNQDFYRDRPIVSPEMAGLPTVEQYDPYTSETLRRLGKAIGMSPLRLQHVFFGLTGGAGRAITSVTDALLEQLQPSEKDFRIAQQLEELEAIAAPNVPPDEVALRRTEFLNSLSVTDREAVLKLARQPEEQVPIIGAITRRFYAPRGGEQYRIGQERAEKKTGKSAEATQDSGRVLGKVFDVLNVKQEAQDKQFAISSNGKAWREAHKESAIMYQGALLTLGVLFPDAAQLGDRQTWTEYQNAVYTLAGAIKDTRTRGQVLAASWRAIPLEEIDPLTKDFDTFFQKRTELRASLSPEDRELLDRTLQSTMTPTEKQYYHDQETLRPYWEIKDQYRQMWPWADSILKEIEQAELLPPGPDKDDELKFLRGTVDYKAWYKTVREDGRIMREDNDAVWAAGERWYGWTGRYKK